MQRSFLILFSFCLNSVSAYERSRKSGSGEQRPYLTDPSRLPPVAPRTPADIRNSREILNLFDQIQTIDEGKSDPAVEKKSKEKKKRAKRKKEDGADKIEEIRIVKRAVSAFKRRRKPKGKQILQLF